MLRIWLRYDLRSSPSGVSSSEICAAALEQLEWADKQGCFSTVGLGEHHGSPDGYNPSPLTFAAAVAARTRRIRIQPCALLLPYHDPVRIAEDAAIADNISNGRLELAMGVGYVVSERAMFGVDKKNLARIMDEKLDVVRRALDGERFEYRGRRIFVTPRPVQQPHPPILIAGSIRASAERAARYDGFSPMPVPGLIEHYRNACAALGKSPGPIYDAAGPLNVYVTEDPDAAWPLIGPYAMHETSTYSGWAAEAGVLNPFPNVDTIEKLRATGMFAIVTPDECVRLARAQADAGRILSMSPLLSGMPAKLSWPSLELFVSKVVPRIQN